MRVVLGNDHAGVGLRKHVFRTLHDLGFDVTDVGTDDPDRPVDFPDMTALVCDPIREGEADRGILLCGTGVGACIAANKTAGIRAALCHDTYCARQGVEHDDVNVVCLGAWIVGPVIATEVVQEFLRAEFSSDPDFRRRVEKLHKLDEEFRPKVGKER